MDSDVEWLDKDQDFYIGKTYSSYFAVALYGEDGIIKATCRNFRSLLEEMSKGSGDEIDEVIETFEDDLFFSQLGEKLKQQRLETQEKSKNANLNKKIRDTLERRDEEHHADILAIVGMTSALSQFSKESLGGGMRSFETENGYKIFAEGIKLDPENYTMLFIPTRQGTHAFLESFIEAGMHNGMKKARGDTVREYINSIVGEIDKIFENEFATLSLISARLEREKKIRHGGKPALLYAPSGVRFGYNLSSEGVAFQSEMETIAKMGKALGSEQVELRYGRRKLLFEDLGDCILVSMV